MNFGCGNLTDDVKPIIAPGIFHKRSPSPPAPKAMSSAGWKQARLVIGASVVLSAGYILMMFSKRNVLAAHIAWTTAGAIFFYYAAYRFRRARVKFVADLRANDFAHCLECGYSLKGLPAKHKCPECGNDFDIAMVQESWKKYFADQAQSDPMLLRSARRPS